MEEKKMRLMQTASHLRRSRVCAGDESKLTFADERRSEMVFKSNFAILSFIPSDDDVMRLARDAIRANTRNDTDPNVSGMLPSLYAPVCYSFITPDRQIDRQTDRQTYVDMHG